jgi:hypothetical protein
MMVVLSILAGVNGLWGQGRQPEGTPACSLDSSKPPHTQIDAIRTCALQLDDGDAFHCRIQGTCDTRWLDEGTPAVFNCIGTLTPEKRAHWNTREDLGRWQDGGGRVTLKVEVEQRPGAGACTGYQQGPVRLPLGVSYVFIHTLGATEPDGKKRARMIIVPADPSVQEALATIKVCWHQEYGYEHPRAQWRHEPVDVKGWWTCADGGCCNM